MAHPWHKLPTRSTVRPPAAAEPNMVVDHRFSEQDLVHLLGALRTRAASHPHNPGLVACWPAVPEQRMAAACRLLFHRGHPVETVSVAGWQSDKTRDGWTLVMPQEPPDTERWTNEGGSFEAGR